MTSKEKHFGEPSAATEREELRGAVIKRLWVTSGEVHIEFEDGRAIRLHPELRGTTDQYLYFQFWDEDGSFIEG